MWRSRLRLRRHREILSRTPHYVRSIGTVPSRHRLPGGPDVDRVVSEGAPAVHVVGDHRPDLGRIRHVALQAGLLSRTRPRALPCGAASRPAFTATRRAGPDESDASAIASLCSHGFAGGAQAGGPGAADDAVLRVRAGAVSAARVDPRRAASRRLQDPSAARPGFRAVNPGAPRPHGERVSGPHRLRKAPDASRYARPPGSRHLPVCRWPPPVACVPPACGGQPPSVPPVPGVCRRDPDRARRTDRHASRVSRREAPSSAALGHGSGAPRDESTARVRWGAATTRSFSSWPPTACAPARS